VASGSPNQKINETQCPCDWAHCRSHFQHRRWSPRGLLSLHFEVIHNQNLLTTHLHAFHAQHTPLCFIHYAACHFSFESSSNFCFSHHCAVSLSIASSAAYIVRHVKEIPNFPPPFSLVTANPSVFLEDSVRCGSFICLSADAQIDRHNAFMISSDSCLHMLLDRDTFTSLGLAGSSCKSDEDRWSCTVELKSASATVIERARNCLQRCPSVPWVCCIQAQSVQEAFNLQLLVASPLHLRLSIFSHLHDTVEH
jgi:hypothetical protein